MAVYQNLSVTQLGQNGEENTSVIKILWQSTQTGPSYNAIADTGRYTVIVNGQEQVTREVTFVLPPNTTETIVSAEEVIFHNDKGEAEVTVKTWMNTHISAGIVELSQTLKLDPIPQASTVVASDGVIGGISRLAVTRKNGESSHTIAWQFGQLGGYLDAAGQICENPVKLFAESLDFSLPESFYSQIPHAKSGICTLTVCTYSGGNPVGEPQRAEFTVSVAEEGCIPGVSGKVTDINPATLALTGDENDLIRYHSTACCTIFAEANNFAQILEKKIQGREAEDSLCFENTETGQFLLQAADSRGFTGTCTLQARLVPYIPLSCLALAERDGPASGEAILSVSGLFYNGSFGTAENELKLSYSIDGVNFIPASAEISDCAYSAQVRLTDMDYTRLHTITVRAEDCLGVVEKQVVLKKGVPTFDWGENDFAFHVPVQMDSSLHIDGDLVLGGKALLDHIYPVGTVYLTTMQKNPGELFGGIWQQLQASEEGIYRWVRTG